MDGRWARASERPFGRERAREGVGAAGAKRRPADEAGEAEAAVLSCVGED